ncbi:hypothetical protein GWK47_013963 [Chionoecetes opilio]|uniref:Uncharacterized protein n=1 Tax=Chionoecetes opilio TaxID=41210 RepID=A0A8J5C0W6_CHIOP|nr:hypothetical protein GWK47_013963 [Chionoecetes opilio]
MPVFEAVGSKQKAMILSLTPPFVHLLQDHCSHVFCQSESELAGTPRRNSASSSPVRGTAMRSSVSPERDGRSFSVSMQDHLSGISWFRSSTIFSAAFLSPREFVGRWDRALPRPPYSQCPFQELER